MSPDCLDARRAVSADATTPEVDAHLGDCDDCRTFAEALDAVRHHATSLIPPPPASLRGEVLEDLGAPATAGRRRRRVVPASRRTALSLLAALGGAVVGLGVVLLVAGSPPADDDAATRLADIAEAHAGAGASHRFDLAGDLELRLPPGSLTEARTDLTARLAELGPVADLEGGAVLEAGFRGQGEADGHGALTYELRWRFTGMTTAGGVLEVTDVDDRRVMRRDGGRWVEVEDGAGFELGVAWLPHHLGEVLTELAEPTEAATMATVELAGEPVDQLRARTATGMVIDAWVGVEDDALRRLRWLPAPPQEQDGTTHGEVVIRFHEHGQSRFVGVPEESHSVDDVDELELPPLIGDLDDL